MRVQLLIEYDLDDKWLVEQAARWHQPIEAAAERTMRHTENQIQVALLMKPGVKYGSLKTLSRGDAT